MVNYKWSIIIRKKVEHLTNQNTTLLSKTKAAERQRFMLLAVAVPELERLFNIAQFLERTKHTLQHSATCLRYRLASISL